MFLLFMQTQSGWVGWSCPAQGPWLQGCLCVTVNIDLERARADNSLGLSVSHPV